MPSRRDFLRSAAALSGAALAHGSIPEAITRALAIDPGLGTTFLDAEHIVVLMQENRSFDHCLGALQGVRGFRDPRAHRQPDGTPVWFQADAGGTRYAPFRLDIKQSNATWLGDLPHSWPDQIDARHGGAYDRWLIAKPKRGLPLTLGHYRRDDLPFYYALADAFTVCDQAFCSSLTGTTPNRLFLWTGNIRANAADTARVQNADLRYAVEASWPTFPERLEDAGVSWRIYQNEVSIPSGLTADEDAWLANFTDNPIEWFTQYNIRFAPPRRRYIARRIVELPALIAAADQAAQAPDLAADEVTRRQKTLADLRAELPAAEAERARYGDAAWEALPARLKALHEKAFTTNRADPLYRSLAALAYQDGGTAREVTVPAGDTLFQFRADVTGGKLPAISWIVAPQNYSDHPSAPWYGAWYVSEVLDILTENPEVWKKTIFVLCYDENDGYFDHVPPFVAPHPGRPDTGLAPGIDTTIDWANVHGRDHSIGLGYRVPMVIASPWSRGGCVNSQVVDHTSVLQLMETWLTEKGTPIRESAISPWRRTVCGNLSSVFRPYDGEAMTFPAPLARDATVEGIHSAQFRQRPAVPSTVGSDASLATVALLQEPGTRPSCPLPYDLHVNAERAGSELLLVMEARRQAFGDRSQGSAFNAYAYGTEMTSRSYAVRAGGVVRDRWPVTGEYRIRIDGPNGFMREFSDGATRTPLSVMVTYRNGSRTGSELQVELTNTGSRPIDVTLGDMSYHAPEQRLTLRAGRQGSFMVRTEVSRGWYDFVVSSGLLAWRYAGRVETGEWSITDPAMGGV